MRQRANRSTQDKNNNNRNALGCRISETDFLRKKVYMYPDTVMNAVCLFYGTSADSMPVLVFPCLFSVCYLTTRI